MSKELHYIAHLQSKTAPTLLLMHGYGANAEDLMQLKSFFQLPHWNFIFVQAPFPTQFPGGYAWFPIDSADFSDIDLRLCDPPELQLAAHQVVNLCKKLNLKKAPLFIGGFSQGAVMSLETAFHLPFEVAGLLLFSGTLIAQKRWEMHIAKKQIPFFQSHGTKDPVLPYAFADELHKLLNHFEWQGQFCSFEGGHTIPVEVLKKAASFLTS